MKKQFLLLFTLISGFSLVLSGQDLPERFYISPDGKRLITGGKPSSGFYDESRIRVLELQFSQPDWWAQLTANYAAKRLIPANLSYDSRVYPNVGVRFRGNTSFRASPTKKSFSISLDFLDSTQRLKGYETLHFNNAAEDPSFLREVFYLHLNRRHIPAAKANFIHLKINGENFGPYPNIQVLNGDFMKEWFLNNDGTRWRAERISGGGFGAGTSTLNFLGADTTLYKPHYTVKKAHKANFWEDLVTGCKALSNPIEDSLKRVFDTDRALWFVAHEIMFGDDDSYVNKGGMDYYVFWDSATRRITPIEYDGNSAFFGGAANWSPFLKETDARFPIMNKLFAVPALRQRYLAHVRTMVEESLDSSYYTPKIDAFYQLIDTFVRSDPKKSTTYAQFQSTTATIKTWLKNRRATYLANAEVARAYPQITQVAHKTNGQRDLAPRAGQQPTVTAQALFATGIARMNLYYSTGLDGYFEKIAMNDDGLSDDGAANDGTYGAKLPAFGQGVYVRYYIEAVANDAANTVAFMPKGAEHDVYFYQVQLPVSSLMQVAINELMADNKTVIQDPNGQYDDWIELFNKTNADINLAGYYLSDDVTRRTKWVFPANSTIPANGYLIIWADEDGTQPGLHANFKLSAGGETVLFSDRDSMLIEQVIFGAQTQDLAYARRPNGTGNFVIQTATFARNNNTSAVAPELRPTDVRIFPNPTDQGLTIEVQSEEKITLRVFDILGREMVTRTFQNQVYLNTETWQNGIYLLKIGNLARKITVSRL
jgi:hypothetical protein